MKANRPVAMKCRAFVRDGLLAGMPLAALGLTALLASCVAPRSTAPTAPPPPLPEVVSPTPSPLPADWRDAPQTPGDWRWSDAGGRSQATFGGGLLTVTCLQPGRIGLAIADRSSAPTVRTTTLTRSIDRVERTGARDIGVSLPAGDPLLDAMALGRGRFALDFGREAPLIVPSWPELGRVIEDCR